MPSLTRATAVLLAASCLVLGLAAAAATTQVPLHVGAGCDFSDYSSLPATAGTPAFHFQFDGGLGAGLYVVHVTGFRLPRNDVLVVRGIGSGSDAASAAQSSVVALSGRNASGDFYAAPVAGNGIVVELLKSASTAATDDANANDANATCVGFAIDEVRFTPQAEAARVAVGDAASLAALAEMALLAAATNASNSDGASEVNESLCGADESQEAACYASDGDRAAMYAASRAVARLVIRKDNNFNTAYCTGFLLGCEGHVLTNQHCVRSWIDALNTGVEFFAEAATCGAETCRERAACPGRIQLRAPSLVAVSTPYDYALLQLAPEAGGSIASLLSQVGGYLQLRASGPTVDEQVFIPQYPLGQGKRIASTADGALGRVDSLSVSTCGGRDVGYNVDTQEGSSGSPVIATSDHAVVALHHCGGCPNGGIPSTQLIADMQQRGVLPKCAVA